MSVFIVKKKVTENSRICIGIFNSNQLNFSREYCFTKLLNLNFTANNSHIATMIKFEN